MLRTILTPLDGSMHAQTALELAIDLAAKCDARLVIMHVGAANDDVPDDVYDAGSRALSEAERNDEETGIPPHQSHYLRVLGYLAKPLLQDAKQLAQNSGVKEVETVIALGDAGEQVLSQAEKTSADLIVMGSRGLGKLTELALGSVSHKVLQLAPCPCVTVHHKGGQRGRVEIERILVPTDGSQPAENAIEFASDIAAKLGAQLILQYVMWRGPSLEDFRDVVDLGQLTADTRDELDPAKHPIAEHLSSAVIPPVLSKGAFEEIGQHILDRGCQIATGKGAGTPETILIQGDPARKIVQVAKSEKADLIVIGSRGLGGAEGFLSGSVSHKVTHAAPCSCMVVR